MNGLDRLAGAVMEKKVSSNVRAYSRKIRRGGLDYRPNDHKYTTLKRGNCTNRAICEMTGEDFDFVRSQAIRRNIKHGLGPGAGFHHDMHSRGFVKVNIPGRGITFGTANKLFGDGVYGIGPVQKWTRRMDFKTGRLKPGQYLRELTHAVPVKRGIVRDHTDPLDWQHKSYRVQAVWVKPNQVKGKWRAEYFENSHIPKVPRVYRLKPKPKRRRRSRVKSPMWEAREQAAADAMNIGHFRRKGETAKATLKRYERGIIR